jgi:DNA mismatch repair ATPase MutS
VSNDFAFQEMGQTIILTGSNMSGKSTFLRSLGVNLSLAYAGSVVNARQLNVGLLRLFTCIRVTDSVTDGISYFYAEVRRLKALLDNLQDSDAMPLFFLIDEIFRGTNNRERLIGSRAYIQALAGKNGIGFISTHDLELIKLADEIAAVKNYHFREHIEDDRLVFD